MTRRRLALESASRLRSAAAATALLVVAVTLGWAGDGPAGAATAGSNGRMVTFGDSVAYGSACDCRPFPGRYAKKVAAHLGRSVRMANFAYPGARVRGVARQLGTSHVRWVVRRSGTAVIMIGANDFQEAFQDVLAHKVSSTDAFPPVARFVQRKVVSEVRTIKRLRPGIHVIVLGYWNVMKDGNVGLRAYGRWGEAKAVEATLDADAGLHRAAVATHSTYVSTYYPFKGYDGKSNCTWLLTRDGDHPNSTGHAVIASALYRAAPRG